MATAGIPVDRTAPDCLLIEGARVETADRDARPRRVADIIEQRPEHLAGKRA